MSSKSLSFAAAAIALLVSNALFAQAPPTVVITFSDPIVVPLDMWSAVAAGLLIAAAGYAYFRHRGVARFGRFSAWLAVIAAAAGTVIGASRLDVIATAQAIAPTLFLTSSPASIVVVGVPQLIQAQNATGRTITILSVTLLNPLPNQSIQPTEGTNCAQGLVLPAGNSCLVLVQQES
jgi:hypothetical protein